MSESDSPSPDIAAAGEAASSAFQSIADKVHDATSKNPEPVDYVLWATPFLFFLSGLVLFFQFPIHPGFFLVVYYLSLITYESINAYRQITGATLSKLQDVAGESTALRAWLNPAVHRILISVIFLALGLGFRFHVAAYIAYSLLPITRLLRDQVGSRVPQASEPLNQVVGALEKVDLEQIAAVLEIALAPWLLLLAIGHFSGTHFLAFLLYVLLVSLYGETILPKHRDLYHKIATGIVGILPALEEKGREPVNQVLEVGKAIYPRSLLEKLKE
jgi:hypothetical protein